MDHLYEAQQFSPEILYSLFDRANEFRDAREKRQPTQQTLKNLILATMFYEPSTRTRLSFETGMMRLGGRVVSSENAKEFSSAVKGESIEDTARVIGGYADCIVLRHHEEGSAKRASAVSPVPVINAGDGKGQHPTQALLDVYTIFSEIGRLENFTIAMVGDLECGRTVRSLSYLLGKMDRPNIIFVAPPDLGMRGDVKEYLAKHNVPFCEESDLDRVLPEVDIVYMTRLQKERMPAEVYEKAKGVYTITERNIGLLKPEARIMHPLPKVEEISLPVELEQTDKRVAYFRQSQNGMFVRMALLEHLLRK